MAMKSSKSQWTLALAVGLAVFGFAGQPGGKGSARAQTRLPRGYQRLNAAQQEALNRLLAAETVLPASKRGSEAQAREALAAIAIEHPALFNQEADRTRTPDDRRSLARTLSAVLEPEAHNREVRQSRSPRELAQEDDAVAELLHPQAFNQQARRLKGAADLKEEDEARGAIMEPEPEEDTEDTSDSNQD